MVSFCISVRVFESENWTKFNANVRNAVWPRQRRRHTVQTDWQDEWPEASVKGKCEVWVQGRGQMRIKSLEDPAGCDQCIQEGHGESVCVFSLTLCSSVGLSWSLRTERPVIYTALITITLDRFTAHGTEVVYCCNSSLHIYVCVMVCAFTFTRVTFL